MVEQKIEYEKHCKETSKKINEILKRNLEEALNVSSKKEFENYFPIQSQRIKILIKLKRLNEALALTEDPRFSSDALIQSQRITILIKLNRLEEALKISRKREFHHDFVIQSQQIKVLIELGRLKEAYELSSEERFHNCFLIQSEKITILTKMGKLRQALALASEPRFKKDYLIKTQKEELEKRLAQKKNSIQDSSKEKKNQRSKKLLRMISLIMPKETSNLEKVIVESNINEWQRVILRIALHEKLNYPEIVSLNYLKGQILIYENHADMLKIIKTLMTRIKSKANFFDIKFYEKLLSKEITFNRNKEKEHLLNLKEQSSPKENRRLTF